MPIVIGLVGAVALTAYYLLYGKGKPVVNVVQQGKTYLVSALIPPDPSKANWTPTQWANAWMASGEWGNVQLTYLAGQGTPPSGPLAKALPQTGWTGSNGMIVKAVRTGPTVPLTGGALAQEV